MFRIFSAAVLFLATTGAALAHPGHSTLAASFREWLHLMLSPDHLLGTVAAVLLAIGLSITCAVRQFRREQKHDSR